MAKEKTLNTYLNGAEVRSHNRKIGFRKKDKEVVLYFRFADEEPDKPACSHECLKGKVRQTVMKLSEEGMEELVYAWQQYKSKRLSDVIG
jgi:hypothetical protein